MKVIIKGDNIAVINALKWNFKDRINQKIKKKVWVLNLVKSVRY